MPKLIMMLVYAYENGRGVDIDEKKANHYYKVAAIGGMLMQGII